MWLYIEDMRQNVRCILKRSRYLEGQGDLVCRLILGIIRVTMWVINILTQSPDPPSRVQEYRDLGRVWGVLLRGAGRRVGEWIFKRR